MLIFQARGGTQDESEEVEDDEEIRHDRSRICDGRRIDWNNRRAGCSSARSWTGNSDRCHTDRWKLIIDISISLIFFVIGGGTAAAAGTAAGAAVFGSLFGIAGAGVTGFRMNKRVGDIENFQFVRLSPGEGSRLHVTIAIPGWLPPPADKTLQDTGE